METKRYRLAILGAVALVLASCTPQVTLAPTLVTPEPTVTTTAVPTVSAGDSNEAQQTVIIQSSAEEQIMNLYDTTSPSVVNISATTIYNNPLYGDVPQEGTGSGFVYDDDGHILTNYHVVEGASELLVTFADGKSYTAELVGSDAVNDLAVIQIDAGKDLPNWLPIGDSEGLRVGQTVLAIGNPFGLDQTLTTGVISALGRVIQSPEDDRFIGEAIQTDAAINPGNSGGPLINLNGEVIGVNSQIISSSNSSAGIGFAVSAATIKRVVPDLIADGAYQHPYLGASMLTLTEPLVTALREAGADIAVDSGLLVSTVVGGGPAEEAGVQGGDTALNIGSYQFIIGGDIITSIGDIEIVDFEDLTVYLETETRVDDTVNLTILRGDEKLTLPVVLGATPTD